ncbi:MAG: hypothetical protein HKO53_05075, partial [Gemmatimonadetes bacterium]|nr:hypothetical protein [Gemmatimonadota bacterium]
MIYLTGPVLRLLVPLVLLLATVQPARSLCILRLDEEGRVLEKSSAAALYKKVT